ncbi:hypothetical protein [Fibrella forsythiae]|uniref:Uncharacterized protein n=1 Tax=Fibrella forsythiae TaxID=2817061 RepID=A0ABS3JSY5_9BACT|nr:hypothetical protein [Fibrella forsythiae]MBO0953119.1 hypothetical protein [Fibrella forsythiae]
MSLYNKKQNLKTQIVATKALLEKVNGHPLMSIGLNAKLSEIQEELNSLPEENSEPKVQLLFSGDAVSGSEGIKSIFVSKAIPPFQELVKSSLSKIKGKRARKGERALRLKSSELFITALPRGSFGIELSQLEPSEAVDGIDISDAIKNVITLISNATSDDNFKLNRETVTKIELVNLKRFLKEIAEENSILKMNSGDFSFEISKEKIVDAYQRVSATIDKESVIKLDGIFRGILLESRKFEFLRIDNGKRISGSISKEINNSDLTEYKSFIDSHCEFHLKTYEVVYQTGGERTEYELLGIKQK